MNGFVIVTVRLFKHGQLAVEMRNVHLHTFAPKLNQSGGTLNRFVPLTSLLINCRELLESRFTMLRLINQLFKYFLSTIKKTGHHIVLS
ncbi:Uncharacterised protein [Vibrio cholerae]|nr:Uncharacterised protein [Vibrio cholerae]CSA15934.1 Uncharacterised protein [Vibrio cholerae]CSD14338.1 Uncharacterised protein [Vibrio cholerae]CSI62620.1 Uncharacterised protein [Vibrio cholerae]